MKIPVIMFKQAVLNPLNAERVEDRLPNYISPQELASVQQYLDTQQQNDPRLANPSGHMWRGAGKGALIGAPLGALLGAGIMRAAEGPVGGGAAAVGALGGLIGGLAGSSHAKGQTAKAEENAYDSAFKNLLRTNPRRAKEYYGWQAEQDRAAKEEEAKHEQKELEAQKRREEMELKALPLKTLMGGITVAGNTAANIWGNRQKPAYAEEEEEDEDEEKTAALKNPFKRPKKEWPYNEEQSAELLGDVNKGMARGALKGLGQGALGGAGFGALVGGIASQGQLKPTLYAAAGGSMIGALAHAAVGAYKGGRQAEQKFTDANPYPQPEPKTASNAALGALMGGGLGAGLTIASQAGKIRSGEDNMTNLNPYRIGRNTILGALAGGSITAANRILP